MKQTFDYFYDLGPAPLIGAAILLAAVVVALLVHALVYRLLLRAARNRHLANWVDVVQQARRIIRAAVVLLAVNLSLPLIQVGSDHIEVIARLVRLCFVGVAGWLAVFVVNTWSDATISRYRIDVEDNLAARKARTRLRVLRQAVNLIIFIVTIGTMLMTFPGARSIGLSLFASAGVAGIVVGFAARPVLSNLLAGIQIALTQPIRIDDAVIIEGEWGWIEEITPTYVVVKIWDWRRLIVPLSYVIEHPFQNWTRESASIIGSVVWHLDYSAPVDAMRSKLEAFLHDSPHWDGQVQVLQVIDSHPHTLELRALMSAKNSPTAWDLRCEIREKMITWLQSEHPMALPQIRAQLQTDVANKPTRSTAKQPNTAC